MPRKSTIDLLPAKIREELSRIIRSGDFTIDQIVEHLHALGAPVSRSAVGRHVLDYEEKLKRYREAQQIAGVWVAKLGEDPQGDVGRLLSEMLKTVAFQQLASLGDDGAEVGPKDLMLLSATISNLAGADKLWATRELLIRKELTQKVEKAIAEAKKNGGGLTEDAAAKIRAALTGEKS